MGGSCVANNQNAEPPSALSPQRVIVMLFCFLALQPLSTDLYLPSLPTIGKVFATDNTHVQLTMSLFVAAYAASQLIAGPFTDRFGRLPGTLIGCFCYFAGSLLCATASSIDGLIIGRMAQGMAVGTIVVCGRSIFRDSFEPEAGARVLAKLYSWIGIVPFTAPFIGGFLLEKIGWFANFWLLSLIAGATTVFCLLVLKETNRYKNPTALHPKPLVLNYLMVLRNAEFRGFTLAISASFCGLFIFLSGSSFVFINAMQLTPMQYSIGFSVVCLGYMTGTQIASWMLPLKGIPKTARIASLFSAAGGIAMLCIAAISYTAWGESLRMQPASLLAPMFVYLCGHGMLQPCCQTGAVGPFPKNAGAASAMLGFTMNVSAAIAGLLLAKVFNGTSVPMSAGIAVAGMSTLVCAHLLIHQPKDSNQPSR